MELSFSTAQIAEIIEPAATRGATSLPVRGIASLKEARAGDLSFLGNPKYKPEVAATAASVVLLPPDYVGEPKPDQLFFIVKNPSVALAQICARVEQLLWPKPAPGIHPSAIVAPTARVAPTAAIGPLCVIESGAVVGERTRIDAQCFIGRHARIGADC